MTHQILPGLSGRPSQNTALRAIADALRDDIASGWLMPAVELAHADTYARYLAMAEG